MKIRNVVRTQDFEPKWITELFKMVPRVAEALESAAGKDRLRKRLENKIMLTAFFQQSTRTRNSFDLAAKRLGMDVVNNDDMEGISSVGKGESLEDTIRVLAEYRPDVIVLRHFETGSAAAAMKISSQLRVPLINAGDGKGQHPTQGLIDLYTIHKNIGLLQNLKVVLGGDLRYGRTCRSLVYLLTKFGVPEFIFVAPERLSVSPDIKDHLNTCNIQWRETDSLQKALEWGAEFNVWYWTRVQTENIKDKKEQALIARVEHKYWLDTEHLKKMSPQAILMHPLPRIHEISTECDKDPRAKYFEQSKHGLPVRMALLLNMLS